ncbi:hypothetical protein LMH73_010265 [Vibrio splendidus]|nr:hypothetical protein [Vibrio splendidus]MCC4883324.1 hypothetical protein [Vibrio splendidus]
MCNQQPELSLEIKSDELLVPVKLKQIRAYVEKHRKEIVLASSTHLVIKPFKSEQAIAHVKAVVMEFLDDMCENLNSDYAKSCSDLYNCCDCGTGNCGCRYCFSCNACSVCLDEDEE